MDLIDLHTNDYDDTEVYNDLKVKTQKLNSLHRGDEIDSSEVEKERVNRRAMRFVDPEEGKWERFKM
jgi:hypothetical protein